MKPGQPTTRTHDYKRHGTTTLFAALDVLEGKVIGRCMQCRRHQEFIRFLNAVKAAVPTGKIILRIPMKPAGDSDLNPATVPI